MSVERGAVRDLSPLHTESQRWVDASIPQKHLLDWRELVIKGMHYFGALNLGRHLSGAYQIRPGSSLPFLRFERVTTPKFLILCYHGVGEAGNPLGFAPTRELFDAQMRFLRENFRVVSLEQACQELRGDAKTDPGIVITFDDGYRSAYTVAFPVLQKYKLPATVYLTLESVETGQVAWYDRVFLAMAVAPSGELLLDLPGPWRFQLDTTGDRLRAAVEVVALLRTLTNSERRECCTMLENKIGLPQNALSNRVLNWEEIHTMHDAGIAFGSHTLTHPVVSRLVPQELKRELSDSKELLERKLGVPVFDFAFPFGKASDCGVAAVGMLSRCGYRSAVTTVPGVNTPHVNSYELRRLQVGFDGSLPRFAFDLTRAFLRMEEPHTLNVQPTDSTAPMDGTGPSSIGGTLGNPDA